VQGIERTSDQLGPQAPSGNCLPFRQPGEQPTNGSSGLAGSPLNSVRGAL
jgi:hypothetical protein